MCFYNCYAIFRQSPALSQLILLYINRSYHIWKESELLPWLERNVNIVLDKVDKADPAIKEYELKRTKRYQGPMPRSICRHIILSDIKGVSPLPDASLGGMVVMQISISLLLLGLFRRCLNIRSPSTRRFY